MRTVNIYAESSTKNLRRVPRLTMYLLELTDSEGNTVGTRSDVIEEEGTYYEAILSAFIRAAERLKKNERCRLVFHSANRVMLGKMDQLGAMADAGFLDSKGEPVRFSDAWEYLDGLLDGHEVGIREGKHAYYNWMMEELQKKGKTSQKA